MHECVLSDQLNDCAAQLERLSSVVYSVQMAVENPGTVQKQTAGALAVVRVQMEGLAAVLSALAVVN